MSDNDYREPRNSRNKSRATENTRRRDFLKYTGASIVGASLLSTPAAAATDDVANGPFRREYVGEPQETEPLCGGGNQFEGVVSGVEKVRVGQDGESGVAKDHRSSSNEENRTAFEIDRFVPRYWEFEIDRVAHAIDVQYVSSSLYCRHLPAGLLSENRSGLGFSLY